MAVDTANGEATEVTETITADPVQDFDAFIQQSRDALIAEGSQGDQAQDAVGDEVNEGAEDQGTQTPSEETQDGDSAELDKPISRREAHKLAESRLKELQAEQQKTQELQAQLERVKAEESALNAEVQKALGTDEEYADLTRRARAGDRTAGAALNQIDANRQFFGKLVQKAQRDVTAFFTNGLEKVAKEVGLEDKIVWEGTPDQIVKAAFDRGRKAMADELQPRLDAAEASARGTQAARAGSRGVPVSGGKPAALDAFESLLGDDGLPTEESIRAAKSGRLAI